MAAGRGIGKKLLASSAFWMTFRWWAFCDLLVTFQLTCRRNSEEAVGSRVVDQRAWKKEPGQEPAEGVAFLLKEHEHPIHGLDTKGVVTWRRRQAGKEENLFDFSPSLSFCLCDISTSAYRHAHTWPGV